MNELQTAQKELYIRMKEKARFPFFLHKSRNPAFLWISDILLRNPGFPLAELEKDGYSVFMWNGLLGIGFSERLWKKLLDELPNEQMVFPKMQEWQALYSLARLLLLHPLGEEMDIAVMNQVYLMTAMGTIERNHAARRLTADCAVLLREGWGLCEPAGRLLRYFINHHECEEDGQ